jgi:hypothetical protein
VGKMIETLQQKLEKRAIKKLEKSIEEVISFLQNRCYDIAVDVNTRGEDGQHSMRRLYIRDLADPIKKALIKKETPEATNREVNSFLEDIEHAKDAIASLENQ